MGRKEPPGPIEPDDPQVLRGFYSRGPVPEKIVCKRCGEERNSIGQEDGTCLRCRWELRAEARADGAA